MKIFYMSFIVAIAFTLLPADAGFLRRKKKVTKVVECPKAVMEGVFVSQDCKSNTRVCPVAVEQSSLLHPSCQGLTKKCPSKSNSIPPGCNSVTTLNDGSTGGLGGEAVDWACTTDDSGVGTCKTEEQCTVENNIKRCRTCTETISVQASEDDDDSGTTSSGSSSSSGGSGTSVQ